MFSAAIYSGDRADLAFLKQLAGEWLQSSNVSAYGSIEKMLADCADGKTASVFIIDISNGDESAIMCAKRLKKQYILPIILVADDKSFAAEAYELHAVHFLTKPVDPTKFFTALDLAAIVSGEPNRRTAALKSTNGLTAVNCDNVMYVENSARTMRFFMSDGSEIAAVHRDSSFEEAMSAFEAFGCFIHPHKSYYINMDFIKTMQSSVIELKNGVTIPISRKNMNEAKDKYLEYLENK